MAAYFTSGGVGTDVQGGTDSLQTLYLMNPNYVGVGYADAAPAAAANMMLLNSAVGSLAPASFGHHQPAPPDAQHLVGIPLQPPPHSGSYNLWVPAAADMSSRLQQQGTPGTSAVSAVLSLSSREAPPVTVASVPGTTEGVYMGASQQEQLLMSSRYLKPAQELLDEAVSVSTGLEEASDAAKSAAAVKKMEDLEGVSSGGAEDGGGSKSSGAAEMSTAERQDLQMKKNKLVNMLDELDQRYRQYHHQMQAVASLFEAAAGIGSSRTYTALALSTISRRFRCLRDAIAAQVRSASRVLGEEADYADGGGSGGSGGGRRTVGSRLRLIDSHLRQQRALQQLGMAQQLDGGAWRPQRGLPERSVSVLRAWLFEHFLHPYPKDSDKVMLARQTGLTRGQVSNWFINARVRLWKPMVEEMYMEETRGKVDDGGGDGGSSRSSRMSNSIAEDSARRCNGVPSSSSKQVVDHVHAAAAVRPISGDQHRRLKKTRTTDEPPPAFHVSDVAALEETQAQAEAAARREEEVRHRELLMKFMEAGGGGERDNHQDGVGGYSLLTPTPYGQFGSEEQFAFAGNGSGVSLTLGLPHGGGTTQQSDSFLMGGSSNASDGAVAAGYDMNMQNTKSLAAQLMRDFVAHN